MLWTLFIDIFRSATRRFRRRATPTIRAARLRDAHEAESRGDMAALAAAGEALLAADAGDAYGHRCLAVVALGQGATQRAVQHAHKAFQCAPGDADIVYHWAVALHYAGRIDEAMQVYANAIELDPGHLWGRARLGMLRLLRGDFSVQAWTQYLANIEIRGDLPALGRHWAGGSHPGETLHLFGHQGLGDQILFGSCIDEVLPQFAQVRVHLDPRLVGLFARALPAARVVALGAQLPGDAPAERDFCAPLAQLAAVYRSAPGRFPERARYLRADPERMARWRHRIDALGANRVIGLSWRGGTQRTRREERSFGLSTFAPLLELPGVRFVSLQYGECAAEIDAFTRRSGVEILHWQEAIDDYEETAALACALDHVVSVTTSLIHLCGALGVPVSVLVDRAAQWRYGSTGSRMPWYRSVRLHRQSVAGDWSGPMREVLETVRALPVRAAGRGGAPENHLK